MEDLTGQKFGMLTVLSFSHRVKTEFNTRLFWNCKCDCGRTAVVSGGSLRAKRSFNKSCGCAREAYNKNREPTFEDLTGQKFGRLIVLSFNRKEYFKGHLRYYWNCVCECGNTIVTLRNSLTSGHTSSCGCLKIDKAKEQLNDLTGQRFGSLVVRNFSHMKNENSFWLCDCDCGNGTVVRSGELVTGNTKSCGCSKVVFLSPSHKKVYSAWKGMLERCYNPNNYSFRHYGARGIEVCERWVDSFLNFEKDMGYPPSSIHSLDRIDVNGNYCPENCRWATPKEQGRNKRDNVRLFFNAFSLCLSEWAENLGIRRDTIMGRLKRGWSEIDALFTPVGYPRGTGFVVKDNIIFNTIGEIVWSY